MCVRVHACMCACVCARVRACAHLRACVRACVCGSYVYNLDNGYIANNQYIFFIMIEPHIC